MAKSSTGTRKLARFWVWLLRSHAILRGLAAHAAAHDAFRQLGTRLSAHVSQTSVGNCGNVSNCIHTVSTEKRRSLVLRTAAEVCIFCLIFGQQLRVTACSQTSHKQCPLLRHVSQFPTFGVGLLDFKLNSRPDSWSAQPQSLHSLPGVPVATETL